MKNMLHAAKAFVVLSAAGLSYPQMWVDLSKVNRNGIVQFSRQVWSPTTIV
jgi:hypothetical protein